ncbi:MAG: hypothetical protein LBR73_04010 [Oscillospiraceae bacterium]|jgi:hypothetical protein|nr:hypothetical protein [Oscillospiraceae bacterium]
MQTLFLVLLAILQFHPLFGWGNAEHMGRELAYKADYIPYVLEDGRESVLVAVPLTDSSFLSLASPSVLRAFTNAAIEFQEETIPVGADIEVVFLSPRHLSGELALHLWGFVFTTLCGGQEGWFGDFHVRFSYAEMNVDEDRIPEWVFDAIGWTVVG